MSEPFSALFADRPEYLELLRRLREELELGNHYLAGMAFAVVEIDDTLNPGDEAALRERLLHRAQTAAERSIRRERGLKRKIADFVVRIDQFLFISLGSVDALTLRAPLTRLAHAIRTEFYAASDPQSPRLRRAITFGVAHWLPAVGYVSEQVMIQQAWKAFHQAKLGEGLADPYTYLALTPSNLDTMRLGLYDWGQSEAAAGPKTSARPSASRPTVLATTAESKPVRKGWLFWK